MGTRSLRRPYLGVLEMAVMDYLWSTGSSDAKTVHRSVGTRRGISLNTIQSTLERLFRKGILTRMKVNHAYVYSAATTREELMTRVIGGVVEELSGGGTDSLLSAFVDFAARVDEQNLERLEQLISRRRMHSKGDKK